MQKKYITRYSLYFMTALLIGFAVVFNQFVNFRTLDLRSILGQKPTQTVISQLSTTCRSQPAVNLSSVQTAYMQKLADYQKLCGSKVADKHMIFTSMPNTSVNAKNMAERLAVNLKDMQRASVQPVVIVEPVTDWGLIDFQEFDTGFYDQWINDYFKALKAAGIADKDMGIWVPFPEANLPYWNRRNATPQDFAKIVNRYTAIYKQYFPEAKASILLNSATYESDDFDWERGEYQSLLPYVKDIKPGLIDSFGLQGFPWSPPASRAGNGIFDAKEFLNHDLATEAARKLGVKEIWFNTGTFASKYAQDAEKRVEVSAQKRKEVSYGITNEVQLAQKDGYTVWVNIFAEDKSAVSEATNWSYLQLGREHQQVFADFITRLDSSGIGISLYDLKK